MHMGSADMTTHSHCKYRIMGASFPVPFCVLFSFFFYPSISSFCERKKRNSRQPPLDGIKYIRFVVYTTLFLSMYVRIYIYNYISRYQFDQPHLAFYNHSFKTCTCNSLYLFYASPVVLHLVSTTPTYISKPSVSIFSHMK